MEHVTAPPIVVDASLQLPFLAGVYLAVNAIGGVRIIVDGPMCAFYKAEFIQGNHQLVADLQRLSTPHRVLHTELDIHRAIVADEGLLQDKVLQAAADPETRALFFTALSSSLLIGRDVKRLLEAFRDRLPLPLVPIPSRSLSGDWLDGWSTALAAVAEAVPLATRPAGGDGRGKPRIGIVGNLFLRHEGDARGDVQELTRLVEALGAQVESIWLSGQPWDELGAIGRADLLVALPYGQEAALRLATRLGVPMVSAPLPFSITGTGQFLSTLAEALDRETAARSFLEAEKARWAPELLFRAEQFLEGTRWLIVGDPFLVNGWKEIALDVGAELVAIGLSTGPQRALDASQGALPWTLRELLRRLSGRRVDGVVGNSVALNRLLGPTRDGQAWAHVELGYPCFGRHPIVPTPSYGVLGELVLLESMCAALHDVAGGPNTRRARP